MEKPPGGYSIDARPYSVIGHLHGLPVSSGSSDSRETRLELIHESGRTVRVPVTMTGFFGAGALEAGTWTVRCSAPLRWDEERVVHLGPELARAEVEIDLVEQPRVELTVRTIAGQPARPGLPLERETWLEAAQFVGTRGDPGERLATESLDREPLRSFLPLSKDEVAGRERTLMIDVPGQLGMKLGSGAWLAFAIGDRVIEAQPVVKGQAVVTFDVNEAKLARALGTLEVRVFDAEQGTPLPKALVTLPRRDGCWSLAYPPDSFFGKRPVVAAALFPHVLVGPMAVRIEAAGRETREFAVDVRPGETSTVEARLARGTGVRGRVLGAASMANATQLELVPIDDPDPVLMEASVRFAKYDEGGEFLFTDLPAGAWVLRSRCEGATFAPIVVDTRSTNGLEPDSASDLAITLARGTLVTLRVPDGARSRVRAGPTRFLDERGLVACERCKHAYLDNTNVRLLPGRYTLAWWNVQGDPVKRDLVVGELPVSIMLD